MLIAAGSSLNAYGACFYQLLARYINLPAQWQNIGSARPLVEALGT